MNLQQVRTIQRRAVKMYRDAKDICAVYRQWKGMRDVCRQKGRHAEADAQESGVQAWERDARKMAQEAIDYWNGTLIPAAATLYPERADSMLRLDMTFFRFELNEDEMTALAGTMAK